MLSFLGHTIGRDGILPDDTHVEAIRDAPAPSDAPMLRSFLGLTAWYAKFIQNYASVVEPMRDVLREPTTFKWTDKAQQSFQKIKELITRSSALALFDPALPTIVSTDASDYSIGGVLSQLHPDNTEKTVASRTLTPTERKYSVVEKEALACVWTTERWRTYLWGTKFTLKTDHQALTTLLATRGMGRSGLRIARWSARLLCFNYDIAYRRGVDNRAADCLSRLPLPNKDDSTLDAEPETVAAISTLLSAVSVSDFAAACSSCPDQKGNPLELVTDNGPQFLSPEFASFLKDRDVKHIRSSIYHPQGNGAVERWNKVLKHAILTAEKERKPWKESITKFLQTYRATPHATTGTSPFKLLFGRQMRTKLNVLPLTEMGSENEELQKRVQEQQQKMKTYTDSKRHAQTPRFKEGDFVRVRKPTHVKKGKSRFTEPLQIARKSGMHSYQLTDGCVWDASRLAMLPAEFSLSTEEHNSSIQQPSPSVVNTGTERRARWEPIWLKDYVTK
ncbi:hypothetical protein SRHO_G00214100 [Serrasalmus rhombeus]